MGKRGTPRNDKNFFDTRSKTTANKLGSISKNVNSTLTQSKALNRLPALESSHSAFTPAPTPSNNAAVESVYRSDVILVQMKIDKCRKLLHLPSANSSGASVHPIEQPARIIDDAEFKRIGQECSRVEDVLARYKFSCMEEAVEKLAVQVALSEMIEKKLMELVTITLEITRQDDATPSAAIRSHEKNSTLSRLPTFVAIIERALSLNVALEHAKSKNEQTTTLMTLTPHVPTTPPPEQRYQRNTITSPTESMITAEGMMSSAQPSSSIQTIAGLKEAENEKKLEEKEKILHLMQKQEQQLHSEIKSMKVELEALQTQYDKKCKEVEVKSNALFEINEKFTKKQQEFELELQKIRDEWKKSDEKILDAKRNALAMQKDQQNTLDENLMLRKSLEEIVQKLEETIRTSQITEETFEKEKNHLIEKLNQVENQLSNVLHVDQLISTKMKECMDNTHTITTEKIFPIEHVHEELTCYRSFKELVDRWTLVIQNLQKEKVMLEEEVRVLQRKISESETKFRDSKQSQEELHQQLNDIRVTLDQTEKLQNERQQKEADRWQAFEEKLVEGELKCMSLEKTQLSLQAEVCYFKDALEKLQKEKRELLLKSMTDQTEIADTYEEVIKQEFHVMKNAFEKKANAAEEKAANLEKDHFKHVQTLIRKHREEMVAEETRSNRLRAEVEMLKEKLSKSPRFDQ